MGVGRIYKTPPNTILHTQPIMFHHASPVWIGRLSYYEYMSWNLLVLGYTGFLMTFSVTFCPIQEVAHSQKAIIKNNYYNSVIYSFVSVIL